MPAVRMYSTRICPYCMMAERLLNQKGVQVEKILIDHDREQMQKMIELTQRRTVPQIFIGEYHVGGYDDLVALEVAGKLDELLKAD
ncbi:glutaredoxin 3 [Beggiatoa leptomitoformis]|uniref:Glutaredoxin n=1 Tax=Beggiatoa leptomitoformis TaxID=288004 RepID=A0A2N9YG03_9GAMM|nr:glutaredoxin 3 [Beggiatoa leptomitoformis]ALG68272.1 glutaredoxin 3 [Beggiatoa leptomitoformis]AUI69417.1 glutaredoxin 3 [Beggiatoa leptomitoformis]